MNNDNKIAEEIESPEEIEKSLLFQSPIPVGWAVHQYRKAYFQLQQLREELEQVKAERDREIKVRENWHAEAMKQAIKRDKYFAEAESLRTELAAKDKVHKELNRVASEIGELVEYRASFIGARLEAAHNDLVSILSQYGGTHETTT
jgi:DNA repair exonuclease SbcCD ATPase subunit